MTKKPHPADIADIEKIAAATHFNVHLRIGPSEKINRRAKTLAAAIRAADAMGKTPGGRKPLIYAVTADKMTVHVPAAMIADERGLANQGKKRLSGDKVDALPARKRKSRTGRQEMAENAAKGILPPVPDFSAATHARFRGKLAEIVKLVEAGDVAGLKAMVINPVSSSPKAMAKYRDLAVIALEARQQKDAA